MEPSTNAGQKRKRYEPPEEELSVKIGRKLHHEVKEVHKASKRAKVFETQKVVKRLRDIRKKNEADKTIIEFEAELTSLKEIDHCAVGNSALRTKVLKDHTLRENEDVKNALTQEVENNLSTPAEAGTTLAKIQSRLLSSKILALQVTSTLNSLKSLLDPTLKQREKAPESNSIDDDIERPLKIRKASVPEDSKSKKSLAKSQPPPNIDQDNESGSEPDEDEAGWESGSINGQEAAEDDGWESGSIDEGVQDDDDDDSEDQSSGQSSVSDSDDDDDNDELKVKPLPIKTKVKTPAKPVKGSSTKMESTFLPSLSVGFVRGDSEDSDFSEGEDKAGGLPKKNRRGQRARRAIWEKKFGRNANHKKKEMEEKAVAAAASKNRNRGHTSAINTGSNAIPSRNFTSTQGPPGNKVPPRGRTVPQSDSGWGGRTNGVGAIGLQTNSSNKSLASKSEKSETKALHPSWEAKRRLKEKESVGIVPSQGTKIKFA